MIKQIAVLISAINVGNQKKILEGMIDAAKETNCNLFVFTYQIGHSEKEENKQGAYQIMKLPDFKHFDGVVIVRHTIQHEPTAKQVLAELKESGIPAVSIDSDLPGMNYIGVLNYEAQYELVEHLIKEHKCSRLCYIAGPSFNEEARERRRAFEDAMKAYNVEYSDDHIIEGFWDEESGKRAVQEFLSKNICPDAVVCANDIMAMGALLELQKNGYQVPKDICVTGFDNEGLSELCVPTLTSVDKNQYDVGREALLILFDDESKKNDRRIIVPTSLALRESCGCKKEHETDTVQIRKRYVYEKLLTQKVVDNLKNMLSDFSGMEQPEELIDAVKKYIVQTDMEEFYLCLCDREKLFGIPQKDLSGTLDLENINTDYTEDMTIPLAYEHGKFGKYGAFPKGMVLPEMYRNKSGGNFYIVNPIYYQRFCYGYCISGNSRFSLEDSLYYSWLMNIGIGLENIRKWLLLKDTVVRLNHMWVYDMLTHLYNRAGFFHFVEPMLTVLKENNEEAFLLFLDIDGLKTVNDTLGHEVGDMLISSMAELIKKNVSETELAMRYGGDEFVIFGAMGADERLGRLTEKLKAGMNEWNSQNSSFQLSASIGGSRFMAKEIDDLSKLIEQADQRMYDEKRKKKQQYPRTL